MLFAVKLLKVPHMDSLSAWDVFELMINAKHVGGEFWIYEGDIEALHVKSVNVVAEGLTLPFGDLDNDGLIDHCEETFGVCLSSISPAWKMLRSAGR